MKHTPPPWKADKGRTVMHITGQRYGVCQISTTGFKGDTPAERKEYAERAEANAALIVRAVNSHDEILSALKDAQSILADLTNPADGLVLIAMLYARARDAELKARLAISRASPTEG